MSTSTAKPRQLRLVRVALAACMLARPLLLPAARCADCADFATPRRQAPLSKLREKTGMALHTKACQDPTNAQAISDEGRILLGDISEAGRRGDWKRISAMLSQYTGRDTPVYNSAMHFALECGQFRAGKQIYFRLNNLKCTKTAPTFTAALKIFCRLGEHDAVRQVWAEAKRSCRINVVLAGARIDAAAADGDVATAAAVLDEMNKTGVKIDASHVTSAIRACWETSGSGHNAAKYLFNLMLDLGLSPDIATMTCLVGAYQSARLADLLAAKAELKQRNIAPDTAFGEVFLTSVLQKPREEPWRLGELVSEILPQRSPERLAAARKATQEFKAAGVELSTLSARISLALEKLEV